MPDVHVYFQWLTGVGGTMFTHYDLLLPSQTGDCIAPVWLPAVSTETVLRSQSLRNIDTVAVDSEQPVRKTHPFFDPATYKGRTLKLQPIVGRLTSSKDWTQDSVKKFFDPSSYKGRTWQFGQLTGKLPPSTELTQEHINKLFNIDVARRAEDTTAQQQPAANNHLAPPTGAAANKEQLSKHNEAGEKIMSVATLPMEEDAQTQPATTDDANHMTAAAKTVQIEYADKQQTAAALASHEAQHDVSGNHAAPANEHLENDAEHTEALIKALQMSVELANMQVKATAPPQHLHDDLALKVMSPDRHAEAQLATTDDANHMTAAAETVQIESADKQQTAAALASHEARHDVSGNHAAPANKHAEDDAEHTEASSKALQMSVELANMQAKATAPPQHLHDDLALKVMSPDMHAEAQLATTDDANHMTAAAETVQIEYADKQQTAAALASHEARHDVSGNHAAPANEHAEDDAEHTEALIKALQMSVELANMQVKATAPPQHLHDDLAVKVMSPDRHAEAQLATTDDANHMTAAAKTVQIESADKQQTAAALASHEARHDVSGNHAAPANEHAEDDAEHTEASSKALQMSVELANMQVKATAPPQHLHDDLAVKVMSPDRHAEAQLATTDDANHMTAAAKTMQIEYADKQQTAATLAPQVHGQMQNEPSFFKIMPAARSNTDVDTALADRVARLNQHFQQRACTTADDCDQVETTGRAPLIERMETQDLDLAQNSKHQQQTERSPVTQTVEAENNDNDLVACGSDDESGQKSFLVRLHQQALSFLLDSSTGCSKNFLCTWRHKLQPNTKICLMESGQQGKVVATALLSKICVIETFCHLRSCGEFRRASDLQKQTWRKRVLQDKKPIYQWVLDDITELTTPLQAPTFRGRSIWIDMTLLSAFVELAVPSPDLRETCEYFVKKLTPAERQKSYQRLQALDGRTITVGSTCSGSDVCVCVMKSTFNKLCQLFNATWDYVI